MDITVPASDPAPPDIDHLLSQVEWLRRLARQIVSDPARADDAAQDAWVAALRHPPGRERDARPWLARVLRNAIRSRLRDDSARLVRERAVARVDVDPAPTPGTQAGASQPSSLDDLALQGQSRLIAAVAALDEDQRHVIVERYWHGRTPGEIAARDGVPVATVKSRLRRALAVMRQRFGESKREADGRSALLAFAWAGEVRVAPLVPLSLIGTLVMGKKIAVALLLLIALGLGLRHGLSPRPLDDGPTEVAQDSAHDLEGVDVADVPSASQVRLAATVPGLAVAWPVDRERDLHGVVVDQDGAPIEGAAVRALHALRQEPMLTWDPLARSAEQAGSATTDAHGRFRIPLTRGRMYDVVVAATGYGDALRAHCLAGERLEVVLERGFHLSGRVVIDGEGVAGAVVIMGPAAPLHMGPTFAWQRRTSDAKGRYRFDDIAPGSYRVSAECAAFLSPPPGRVAVLDRDVTHQVVLWQGRVVQGRVVDDFSGDPLAGVRVEAGRTGAVARTLTAEDGTYRLVIVVEGTSTSEGGNRLGIVAQADGHLPALQRLEFLPATTEPETVDFRLVRGATVRGKIVIGDGEVGLAKPLVRGATIDRRGARPSWQLRLNGDVAPTGEFELHGVRTGLLPIWPEADPRLKVNHPQTALLFTAEGCGSEVLVLPRIREETPIFDAGEIVLHPEATISGRVVDEDGAPVPDATVTVSHSVRWPASTEPSSRGVNPRIESGLAGRTLETDDLGRFHCGGLPPGMTVVRARRLVGSQKDRIEVELNAGDRLTGLELVLPKGKSISGRIVTADGRGVAHARLLIFTPRGGFGAMAGPDGSFRVAGLDDLPCDVLAYELDSEATSTLLLSQKRTGIAAGTDGLKIVLPSAVMVRGTVFRSDGTAAPDAVVRMKTPGYWRDLTCTTDEEGAFEVLVPEDTHLDVFVKPSYPDMEAGEVDSKATLVTGFDPASGPLVLHLGQKRQ